ncbi:MAG: glycerophosphodiester phosphodiesterase family protein, partial [Acholeplasmataceae bacterium]
RFKELNPNLETVLLISVFFGQIDTLFELDYIDHFGLRISILQRDPEITYRIHRFGKKVYAWTADTREDIAIGVKADVDGFITKRPIEAREIAHSKSSNETFTELLQRLFGITQ